MPTATAAAPRAGGLGPQAFVSLAEAKAYLLIKGTDRDAQLEDVINRVSDYCEQWCGAFFKRRAFDLRYPAQRGPKLHLRAEPLDLLQPLEVTLGADTLPVWTGEGDGDRAEFAVYVGADLPGVPNHLWRAAGWLAGGLELDPEPVRVVFTGGADPIAGDLLDAFYQVLTVVWREQTLQTADLASIAGGAGTGSVTMKDSLIPYRAKQTLDAHRMTTRT